ncbi:MAG: alpha-hydroxy acid oxidase [Pseudomonadota bacterium]
MRGIDRAASIEDLRLRARRRIPRFAFDLVDGGAETERNLARNTAALEEVELTPRYMRDVGDIDLSTEVFGRRFAAPFGMAPIGMLNAFWPGADLMLARLCAHENIPYTASSAASTTLEELAEAAEGNGWFQLYVSCDTDVTESLIARAEAAGYDVMFVTADVPAAGKRDRDIRNQLSVPFKFTPDVLFQIAQTPRWALASIRSGTPRIANYADLLQSATPYADVQKTLITPSLTWEGLARIRERWKGKLIVKGVLHPEDAVAAAELGCDGIVVSNHGGRQVDFGPSTISALPAIADAVSGRLTVLFDSGIRRGSHVLRAMSRGAGFVLAGRALAYGVGAGGEHGAHRAFDILALELTRALGQLGARSCREVSENDLFTVS